MSFVCPVSNERCKAAKSGTPVLPGTTISPSYQPGGSFNAASAVCNGSNLPVQSWPLRVSSLMRVSSTRAISR